MQMLVVDRVNTGLFSATQAVGRRRLAKTISDFSKAITRGLSGIVGSFGFGVISLRQCASGNGINDGCGDGTVLATGSPDIRVPTRPPSGASLISANLNLLVTAQMAIAGVYIVASFL